VKFVRFGNWSTGVVLPNGLVLDLTASVHTSAAHRGAGTGILRSVLSTGDFSWDPLITLWPTVKPAVEELVAQAVIGVDGLVVHELDRLQLLPPLSSPRARVFAMAANFADHASRAFTIMRGSAVSEQDAAEEILANLPAGFVVIPGTVVGHDAVIVPPPGQSKLDYEVEAAIVLAPPTPSGQLQAWGYTAWNDISVRDKIFGVGSRIDQGPLIWTLQKNWKTGNAAGPWVVVEDDIDVQQLSLRTFVNGQMRQDSSTAKMLNSFQSAFDLLSAFVGLGAGDMLVSGTPHGVALESGVDGPYLKPGDVVEVEVGDESTRLRNVVGEF
jgi:2-keto-4-pentenoate hydratase/2-oxohepta-3-ene-1,7-dioic acid hydratase in catechol pathway